MFYFLWFFFTKSVTRRTHERTISVQHTKCQTCVSKWHRINFNHIRIESDSNNNILTFLLFTKRFSFEEARIVISASFLGCRTEIASSADGCDIENKNRITNIHMHSISKHLSFNHNKKFIILYFEFTL